MLILGIESSCDETAAAVVADGWQVKSNVIASQIALHAETGGVVPEVAAREHVIKIIPVIDKALKDANLIFEQIDAIGVTYGPGLLSSLVTGTTTASTLALIYNKPLIAVNHIYGHIYSNWLTFGSRPDAVKFPVLVLTVSGGHNELVLMRNYEEFEVLGRTRDDSAGEAFDKVARMLGLGYPGGPAISKSAQKGDSKRFNFPRVMLEKDSLDFSFSGLKTAVLYLVRDQAKPSKSFLNHVAASFQEAVTDILTEKVLRALRRYQAAEMHLAGGVSANLRLRQKLAEKLSKNFPNCKFKYPEDFNFCTDNAAMIAAAAFFKFQKYPQSFREWKNIEAKARLMDL